MRFLASGWFGRWALCAISACALWGRAVPSWGADTVVPAPSGSPEIVDTTAKLELLYTRSAKIAGGLTEGPATAPDGSIYFSDIPVGADKGLILRFDPKTKMVTVFAEDSHKSNGLDVDSQGRLIACEGADAGGRALTAWDTKTKSRTVLTDNYQGKRFNAPNDLTIDRQGRIYFSDPKYLGAEKRELEYRSVYRFDGKNTVEVTHEVEKPNGVALSPDEKWLYVADHNNGVDRLDDPNAPPGKPGAMKIYKFPLGPDGLVNGPRQTIVDFKDQKGCDGMTVDAKGHIYLTVREPSRPGVMAVDPSGKEVAFIPTGPSQPGAKEPIGLPSNVTFGRGAESKVLYITVDKSLYRITTKAEGYLLPQK